MEEVVKMGIPANGMRTAALRGGSRSSAPFRFQNELTSQDEFACFSLLKKKQYNRHTSSTSWNGFQTPPARSIRHLHTPFTVSTPSAVLACVGNTFPLVFLHLHLPLPWGVC